MIDTIDFYAAARAGARRFLLEPTVTTQRCLLAGHDLEEGEEIAACVICQQEGCPDCLDTHDCADHERIL